MGIPRAFVQGSEPIYQDNVRDEVAADFSFKTPTSPGELLLLVNERRPVMLIASSAFPHFTACPARQSNLGPKANRSVPRLRSKSA